MWHLYLGACRFFDFKLLFGLSVTASDPVPVTSDEYNRTSKD